VATGQDGPVERQSLLRRQPAVPVPETQAPAIDGITVGDVGDRRAVRLDGLAVGHERRREAGAEDSIAVLDGDGHVVPYDLVDCSCSYRRWVKQCCGGAGVGPCRVDMGWEGRKQGSHSAAGDRGAGQDDESENGDGDGSGPAHDDT
jgi:hypothetical protein